MRRIPQRRRDQLRVSNLVRNDLTQERERIGEPAGAEALKIGNRILDERYVRAGDISDSGAARTSPRHLG